MQPAERETIGLIGVGLLGTALAARWLESGLTVQGFDTAPDRAAALEALGGRPAPSAAEVARACTRLVLCLPHSGVTAMVLQEITSVLRPGSLVVDSSTSDPEFMADTGKQLAELGVDYVDACVGGSSAQVRRGEAVVMAGGSVQAWERSRDLFDAFAKKSWLLGPPGSGARMKLVFNLVLGLNRAVLAEGLEFAAHAGIAPSQALEVLREGAAYSGVMDTKGERMVTADFSPEARLSQHRKDVRLILAAAERWGAVTPLSHVHDALLERAEALGYGQADNSAVITAFQSRPDR